MKKLLEVVDSFGLSISEVATRVRNWDDVEFERFFSDYITSRKEGHVVLAGQSGRIDVFPDSLMGRLPLDIIRQLCIYVNRIYLHDPVLRLREEFDELDSNFDVILRAPERADRLKQFRERFAKVFEEFLKLRPLVEIGALHVVPTGLIRPRRAPGTLYATDLYGPTGQFGQEGVQNSNLELPPALKTYINDHLIVSPAEVRNGRWAILGEELKQPTRIIAVRFADGVGPKIFFLSTLTIKDKSDREFADFTMECPLDGHPGDLDLSTFEHWVVGEAQKYVRTRLNDLNGDLYLASLAGARFLTSVSSSQQLLQIDLGGNHSEDNPIASVMEFDLPYLAEVSIDELAKARQNEASFAEFQVALEKASTELRKVNPSVRQQRIDEIMRDLVHAPISRIESKLKALQRNVFVDCKIAVGAFGSALLSGGTTMLSLASLAAAAKAADTYKKAKTAEDSLRTEAGYFYWNATRGVRLKNK